MNIWKRSIDVAVSALVLISLAPTMALVAVALRRSTGESALLRQIRAGRSGTPFALLKFRTMTQECDETGELLPDAARLTRFGRIVRSLSIDELPQVVNVLRGEMSLVGPRPLPLEYAQLYTPRERTRLHILPGITGWAQVNGRQRISFGQRLEYDAWYVDNWSLRLDLKVIVLTIPRLIRGIDVMPGQDISEVDDRGFGELWRRYHSTRGNRHVTGISDRHPLVTRHEDCAQRWSPTEGR